MKPTSHMPKNIAPTTPVPSCSSNIDRHLAATKGLLRSLSLVLALSMTAATAQSASNATKYMFVPGHGLTGKSGNAEFITTDQLILECKNTGPWMRFVEREYDWGDLQDDGPKNTNKPGSFIYGNDALGNPKGISEIIDDANKCYDKGLKLRVMLMHKFAHLPKFLTFPSDETHDGNLATVISRDPKSNLPVDYNIKLDQDIVLTHLKNLYAAVIAEFKKPEIGNARSAFYGFVIQEHAFGTSSYWNTSTQKLWVDNLIKFHTWLAGNGRLFNFGSSTIIVGEDRAFRSGKGWRRGNFRRSGSRGRRILSSESLS